MGIVIDKLIGALFHDHPFRNVDSDPASGKNGEIILNTAENKIKVWYASSWQVLHILNSADKWLLETADQVLWENADYALLESVTTSTDNNLALEG